MIFKVMTVLLVIFVTVLTLTDIALIQQCRDFLDFESNVMNEIFKNQLVYGQHEWYLVDLVPMSDAKKDGLLLAYPVYIQEEYLDEYINLVRSAALNAKQAEINRVREDAAVQKANQFEHNIIF